MSLLIFLQMEHMIKFLGGKHPTYMWEGRGPVPCTAWGYLLRNWDVRPPKTSLRCGRQLWNCFPSMGDSYRGRALKRTALLRSKWGKKELKSSAPAFTSKLGALCRHAAAGWSDPVHGTFVLHRPQASLCFMCQLLFGDLTWFIHEQNPTKTN